VRRFLAPRRARVEPAKPPTFSIVTAAYQAGGTVGEAVESALGQTVAPLEVIVCDDGSTDDTAQVLARYEDRIVYLSKENGGTASALNACFARARGDFVLILDADDTLERAAVEALAELGAARPDLDILMVDACVVVDDNVVGRFSAHSPFVVENQSLAIFDRCFIQHPAVRRSRLLELGGYDESLRIAHDWDCWLRLLLTGSHAGFCDEPLYRYRVHGASLTANRLGDLRERVHMLEKAMARDDLASEQRRALKAALARHATRARLAEIEEALVDDAPDRRQRAMAVALASGIPPVTRLKSLAAAVAPSMAARHLARREARTGISRRARPKLHE
jgi:glycosyltransferase involved in cell wall biosynthesis